MPDADVLPALSQVALPLVPTLSATQVGKKFGESWVLRDVSFEIAPGEALAIIGENGAGKSTLMKILSGAHRADAGQLTLNQASYAPHSPAAALGRGVAMIYQELSLAPDLSVEDNVMLGQEQGRLGWLNRSAQRERVIQALSVLGHGNLDLTRPVRELPVGIQQLIEIARALVADARVMIFDEPTSSLTKRDVARLFEVIDTLRARGVAVLYISHFLEEVRRVADRYLVLRDGAQVASGRLDQIDDRGIVAAMVGREVDQLFPKIPHEIGEPRLRLTGLSGMTKPTDASLVLHRGEILGIAGLVGAGRTELLRTLFGTDVLKSGSIELDQQALRSGVGARIRRGLGMVSEDRKTEGLALGLSILENATLSRLSPFTRAGWLLQGKRRAAGNELVKQFQIRQRSLDQPVGELSGGNQQKVALARLANQQAQILLLDEPTRGIDVGTKAEIYRQLGNWAAEGRSIIMVSSYIPELMGTCDRIAVMSRGRIIAVKPTSEWTEHQILEAAIAADEASYLERATT